MRTQRVVHDPPFLDHDLRLFQRIENLPVQAFIPQLPVEALAIPVLPWASRFDVQRRGSQLRQPLPQFLYNKLGPVVRTNVFRDPPEQHHVCQRFDYFVSPQSSGHPDRQALPRVLVEGETALGRGLP